MNVPYGTPAEWRGSWRGMVLLRCRAETMWWRVDTDKRVSRSNNGGAQRGWEKALVGVANVVDRKTEDREEIRRRNAKDWERSLESSLKQKLLN